MPAAKPGNFVAWTNGLNEQKRREVTSVGKEVTYKDEKGREMRRSVEGNFVADWDFNRGDPLIYSPHNYFFKFPLCPGDAWGGQYTVKNMATSSQWTSERRAKVGTQWTDLDLNGKKLRAIEINYTFISNVARLGRIESTCLYSPEIGTNVKCVSNEPRFAMQVTDWGL